MQDHLISRDVSGVPLSIIFCNEQLSFPNQGEGHGPSTLALQARQRFVHRELTGREQPRACSLAARAPSAALLDCTYAVMFLPFPLSTSSLRCVCVARSLSPGSSCSAGERNRTLGARCCHSMSLCGL